MIPADVVVILALLGSVMAAVGGFLAGWGYGLERAFRAIRAGLQEESE